MENVGSIFGKGTLDLWKITISILDYGVDGLQKWPRNFLYHTLLCRCLPSLAFSLWKAGHMFPLRIEWACNHGGSDSMTSKSRSPKAADLEFCNTVHHTIQLPSGHPYFGALTMTHGDIYDSMEPGLTPTDLGQESSTHSVLIRHPVSTSSWMQITDGSH